MEPFSFAAGVACGIIVMVVAVIGFLAYEAGR